MWTHSNVYIIGWMSQYHRQRSWVEKVGHAHVTCLEICKNLHMNWISSAVSCVIKLEFFTHMPLANISLALANPQGRWHQIKLMAAGLYSWPWQLQHTAPLWLWQSQVAAVASLFWATLLSSTEQVALNSAQTCRYSTQIPHWSLKSTPACQQCMTENYPTRLTLHLLTSVQTRLT